MGPAVKGSYDPEPTYGLGANSGRPTLIKRHDGRVVATAGDIMSNIDWDNIGANLDDEGKEAEIAAAAGSRYCAVASLR